MNTVSDNGMLPVWCQNSISTNADPVLNGPLLTNCSAISILGIGGGQTGKYSRYCHRDVYPFSHDDAISALLALCEGHSPVTGEFPSRRALVLSFICAWTNGWVNNRKAGDLWRHCADYDVIVMYKRVTMKSIFCVFVFRQVGQNHKIIQPCKFRLVHHDDEIRW